MCVYRCLVLTFSRFSHAAFSQIARLKEDLGACVEKLKARDAAFSELEAEAEVSAQALARLRVESETTKHRLEDQIRQIRASSEILDQEQTKAIAQLRFTVWIIVSFSK